MISSLEIANFRGIAKLSLPDLKRFNVFIGKNDARKSTILETIYAFKAMANVQPNEFRLVLRSSNRIQLARELWHNYNTKIDPTVKITTTNNEKCTLTFHIGFDVNTIDVTLNVEGKGRGVLKLDGRLTNLKFESMSNFLNTLEENLRSTFHSMIFFNEPYRLNVQQWEQEINTKLLPAEDIYDKSISFSRSDYTEGQQRLSLVGENTDVYLDSFGEGHKAGLSLLTIVKGYKKSIILIEEIETHQHPSSLRDLIERLQEICVENDNQVFVTTHSPEVLQLFSNSQEALLFHLQKGDDSTTMVNCITPKDVSMMRDIGWDIGNLLKYEKFVIVEGEIDQIVIRHSFKKVKNYWPEEIGINIISAGGFSKEKELLKALSSNEKNILIQRDYDDKNEIDIKNEIFNGFKELEREGYQKIEDDDKILLTHNSGTVKKLIKNNVFVTGLPSHFTSIRKHAVEDYMLYMIQQNPSIVNKINASATFISTFDGQNSKEILTTIFGNYDSSYSSHIIKEADIVNFPVELISIIDKIEKS